MLILQSAGEHRDFPVIHSPYIWMGKNCHYQHDNIMNDNLSHSLRAHSVPYAVLTLFYGWINLTKPMKQVNVIISTFPIKELEFIKVMKCAYGEAEPGSWATVCLALLSACVEVGMEMKGIQPLPLKVSGRQQTLIMRCNSKHDGRTVIRDIQTKENRIEMFRLLLTLHVRSHTCFNKAGIIQNRWPAGEQFQSQFINCTVCMSMFAQASTLFWKLHTIPFLHQDHDVFKVLGSYCMAIQQILIKSLLQIVWVFNSRRPRFKYYSMDKSLFFSNM